MYNSHSQNNSNNGSNIQNMICYYTCTHVPQVFKEILHLKECALTHMKIAVETRLGSPKTTLKREGALIKKAVLH